MYPNHRRAAMMLQTVNIPTQAKTGLEWEFYSWAEFPFSRGSGFLNIPYDDAFENLFLAYISGLNYCPLLFLLIQYQRWRAACEERVRLQRRAVRRKCFRRDQSPRRLDMSSPGTSQQDSYPR